MTVTKSDGRAALVGCAARKERILPLLPPPFVSLALASLKQGVTPSEPEERESHCNPAIVALRADLLPEKATGTVLAKMVSETQPICLLRGGTWRHSEAESPTDGHNKERRSTSHR